MLYEDLNILYQHGSQYIPKLDKVKLPYPFRGKPILRAGSKEETEMLVDLCPTHAITNNPFSLDLGKCVFCGECTLAFPERVHFSQDYFLATNDRNKLTIVENQDLSIRVNPELIRKEIKKIFQGSLKLRQVSAGGDNSAEMELGACGNVNFDMGRYGIEFVASPRHADGIVITGPMSSHMAEALEICYQAIPEPKLVILAGTDAISGGIFAESPALDRSFLQKNSVDLYVPGNPPHPLTFINGILHLIGRKSWKS